METGDKLAQLSQKLDQLNERASNVASYNEPLILERTAQEIGQFSDIQAIGKHILKPLRAAQEKSK